MAHQQAVDPEERLRCVTQTHSGVGDTVMHIHLIALKSQAIINEPVSHVKQKEMEKAKRKVVSNIFGGVDNVHQ